MITNSFIWRKMENTLEKKRKSGKKVCLGFVRRNAENEEEMYVHPELLCDDYLLVDPLRFTVNYTGDKAVFRILFDDDAQSCTDQVKMVLRIKSLLENDFDCNESHFWSVLLIERVCQSLYAFELLSIHFLPNNKGAALVCTIEQQLLHGI